RAGDRRHDLVRNDRSGQPDFARHLGGAGEILEEAVADADDDEATGLKIGRGRFVESCLFAAEHQDRTAKPSVAPTCQERRQTTLDVVGDYGDLPIAEAEGTELVREML